MKYAQAVIKKLALSHTPKLTLSHTPRIGAGSWFAAFERIWDYGDYLDVFAVCRKRRQGLGTLNADAWITQMSYVEWLPARN